MPAPDFDIVKFYKGHLDIVVENAKEMQSKCPFHDDNHVSFSINKQNGLWKCFAASCKHQAGNVDQFIQHMDNISPKEAKKKLLSIEQDVPVDHTPISQDLIDKHHNQLLRTESAMDTLRDKCGYSINTLKRFNLGWDGQCIWIPIMEQDKIVNIRKYDPSPKAKIKVRGIAGKNQARLWPLENMQGDIINIMEGEKDCMLANQMGLNSVTVTGGAGTFRPEWIPMFKDKVVRICYDIDAAGKAGAKKVAQVIGRIVKEVKIINLPIKTPPNGDFTDYVLKHDNTSDDYQAVVREAKPVTTESHAKVTVSDDVVETSLDQASKSTYFYKRVRSQVIIAGKDLAPYLVPKVIRVTCSMGKKFCGLCGIGDEGGDFDKTFDYLSPDTLKLINCTDTQQSQVIHNSLKVKGNCNHYKYSIIDAQNIEELKIIPEITYSSDNKEYVCRTAYHVGHDTKTNNVYDIEAVTMPHPQTQYATHLIYSMELSQSGIEQFRMTDDIRRELAIFKV